MGSQYQRLTDEPSADVSLLTHIASVGESNPNLTFAPKPDVKESSIRDNVAFWFCGLLNNFGYVVMLSAALSMMKPYNLSPSIVLLADIFPSLIVQILAPYFMSRIPYTIRIIIAIFLDVCSFLICAFFSEVWAKLIGVAFASIGSGFGEITFLAYSSHYHKNTVSAWSSGTGAAGILGAVTYLGLNYAFSNKTSLIISSPLPLGIAIAFFFILTKPAKLKPVEVQNQDQKATDKTPLPFKTQMKLIFKLLPYGIPLGLVYFGEYLINQAVTPALTFPKDKHFSDNDKAYMWYQLVYQTGVFISRSSVKLLPIKSVFLLQLPAILQTFNVILLSLIAVYNFVPSIYAIFVIIFWEGLLGGCIYVNTFYLMSQRFEGKEKEFCMGATSQAYGISITLAALIGIPYEPMLKKHRRANP